ncbi:MAG: HAMP domain-containing histidine kinase [Pseudomonadales bacterium]|nr:HAMP domain-containing histidine kinase [Pseudomonadales bacterium]
MIHKRIFATYTFRFMIAYVAALSIAAFILLVGTYFFYSYDYFSQVNDAMENELNLLHDEYSQHDIAGLELLSQQRRLKSKYDRFSYILTDGQRVKLSGDLKHWPEVKAWADGWLSFEMSFADLNGNAQNYAFVARSRTLDDGRLLMVARVSDDIRQNVRIVLGTLIWGMVIMILLGIIGGIVTSVISLQRVEMINDAIRRIMAGDLSERITVQDPIDDFQQLAMNLNEMLDRIEDSVNDVRQVSNNIAHDLRTPLTRLRNKLSLLEKRSAPHNVAMVRAMLGEADSLLSTFSALLRIAQVESGSKKSNFTQVDLSEVFTDVVELYEPLASVKGIELTVQKSSGLLLQGDKDLLFQMLANLIDNAIKYSGEAGAISLALEVNVSQLSIVIADNGPGIAVNKHEKVFQRFYRVEASRSVQPGNGLGLSLVRAVVKLHGGEIKLTDSSGFFPKSSSPGLQVLIKLPIT